jgi:hypothetical protein
MPWLGSAKKYLAPRSARSRRREPGADGLLGVRVRLDEVQAPRLGRGEVLGARLDEARELGARQPHATAQASEAPYDLLPALLARGRERVVALREVLRALSRCGRSGDRTHEFEEARGGEDGAAARARAHVRVVRRRVRGERGAVGQRCRRPARRRARRRERACVDERAPAAGGGRRARGLVRRVGGRAGRAPLRGHRERGAGARAARPGQGVQTNTGAAGAKHDGPASQRALSCAYCFRGPLRPFVYSAASAI